MSAYDTYKTPLDSRYASKEIKEIFGARNRHSTWRQLWFWLAQAEKETGVEGISDEALAQMRDHLTVTDEDFEVAAVEEKIRRHDVMAHVHAFGKVAPAAAGIIHYGATSCYVTDNAELILMRDAMDLLLPKLAKVIKNLSTFALEYKDLPTLGYTHYQPAQLITVGRRACQWIQDLTRDLKNIETQRKELRFRGAMGTTGTQASFMEIYQGNGAAIDKLNDLLCQKAGFPSTYDISVQTYSRKVDLDIANAICGLGATAIHMTSDLRHLATMKEIEEPFEAGQIGSSAMALPNNFTDTYSDQWFERSLDDSAIRRIDIPEMFLLADAILLALDNVTSGMVVYPKRIQAHVMEELPFMATEISTGHITDQVQNIIMKIVAKGGSRQDAHEEIRVLSHQASDVVKKQGGKNDLIERIRATEYFKPVWDDLDNLLDPTLFIGRCPEIVQRYCGEGSPVEQAVAPYTEYISKSGAAQLNV